MYFIIVLNSVTFILSVTVKTTYLFEEITHLHFWRKLLFFCWVISSIVVNFITYLLALNHSWMPFIIEMKKAVSLLSKIFFLNFSLNQIYTNKTLILLFDSASFASRHTFLTILFSSYLLTVSYNTTNLHYMNIISSSNDLLSFSNFACKVNKTITKILAQYKIFKDLTKTTFYTLKSYLNFVYVFS